MIDFLQTLFDSRCQNRIKELHPKPSYQVAPIAQNKIINIIVLSKWSAALMAGLGFALLRGFRARLDPICRLTESCFGNIVAELAWQPVVPRSRILIVLCNWFSISDSELSS